jgi:hypothetical protein
MRAIAQEEEEEEEEEEEVPTARTVLHMVFNTGAFAVFQREREAREEHWQALTRELGDDITFPRMLVKVLLAGHGVTPPCASLDPQLLCEMKAIWAWRGASLKACDLDHVDAAMGRAVVVRCRVCYKPCDHAGGVHAGCQVASLACNRTRPPYAQWFTYDVLPEEATGCGYCGEMEVPVVLSQVYPQKPPAEYVIVNAVIEGHGNTAADDELRRQALRETRENEARHQEAWKAYNDGVRRVGSASLMADIRRAFTKCPRCGERVSTMYSDKPEERPSSSKVSRKRAHDDGPAA